MSSKQNSASCAAEAPPTVAAQPPDPDAENAENASATESGPSVGHRKTHKRHESMYMMTGLYSETGGGGDGDADADADDTNADVEADDTDEDFAAETTGLNQQPAPGSSSTTQETPAIVDQPTTTRPGAAPTPSAAYPPDTVIRCHSRQASAAGGVQPRSEFSLPRTSPPKSSAAAEYARSSQDCGLLGCRPQAMQKFARIKIFVLLLSILVTLQQALSSGYINSVITTIEKRFDIPSSYSGLIASSYEIGNVITVIFVSYLGSRRHIPVWIGIGAVIMGIGSLIFMVPHFTGDDNPGISLANKSSDNICRGVSLREPDMGLGRLSSGLAAVPPPLREDNCIQGRPATRGPVLMFVLAQLLLGCGGSPLFTLGTTYVDDHVRTESASMYIGAMYSMAAFGPVVGFLLGAYLLSFHMDSMAQGFVPMDSGDRRWVGMWWGGFLICGVLLILVAIPFFSFPKVLTYERKKLRKLEMINNTAANNVPSASKSNSLRHQPAQPATSTAQLIPTSSSTQLTSANQQQLQQPSNPEKDRSQFTGGCGGDSGGCVELDSGYGKDIKDLPRSMWRLFSNPVYITTCLGASLELMIVSGFIVFLPKYLETQFSLGKSQASVFTGSIAIPGACIGIFMGGCFLKRFQLTPRGAVQFVLISNLICLSCYTLLFFLGCENVRMAGTTIPYYNSSAHAAAAGAAEPFQVNLTAACNFGCECRMSDVEPVCGNNGLTYFSPCHAGCTAFSSTANYTNCACVHANVTNFYAGLSGGAEAQASVAAADFSEVTVVPVATAGPCTRPCRTIYPFLILLFFMTFIVAATQMPLLMIVLRSVSEEERSFALGMQFVIFRLFGYIPAPILFGNLIDSTCLLWKSTCGEKGGRCLIYNIEAFRYKYVGLCTVVKIIALIIFGIDWLLVTRRKTIDDEQPMTKEEMSGSMLSLNNAAIHRAPPIDHGDYSTDTDTATNNAHSSAAPPNLHYESSGKRILVASHRHLRNDSKTIQLEMRGGDPAEAPAAVATSALPPVGLAPAPRKRTNTHYRSSSCDVKMMHDHEDPRLPAIAAKKQPPHSHSRTNSRDLDFRSKLPTHSRQNSSDRHNTNIKYILNYLNTPRLVVPAAELLAATQADSNSKRHQRNHSYDQIYMPQQIRIDQEFQRRFQKNVSRKNSVAKADGGGGQPPLTCTTSKDLNLMNIVLTEDQAGNSVLRHRRTNSRDLNRQAVGALEASSVAAASAGDALALAAGSPKHVRHGSQHRIQIDGLAERADGADGGE